MTETSRRITATTAANLPDRNIYDDKGLLVKTESRSGVLPGMDARRLSDAVKAANSTGIPVAQLDPSNLPVINAPAPTNLSNSPNTAAFLSNPVHATIAQHDNGVMAQAEAVFGNIVAEGIGAIQRPLGGSLALGRATLDYLTERPSALDYMKSPVSSIVREAIRPGWQAVADAYEFSIGDFGKVHELVTAAKNANESMKRAMENWRGRPEDQTLVSEVAGGVTQVLATIVQAAVAPQTVLPSMFFTGVEQQAEQQAQKGESNPSMQSLIGGGTVTAASEKLRLDRLLDRIPAPIRAKIGEKLSRMFMEGGEEAVQEVVEGVTHNIISNVATGVETPILQGAGDDATVAGITGGLVRLLLDSAIPGRERINDSEFRKNSKDDAAAERDQKVFDDLDGVVKDTQFRSFNPELYAQFVQANDLTNRTTVFINQEALRAYLEKLATDTSDAVRVLRYSLDSADSMEAPAMVSLEDYATHVAGSPHSSALRGMMSFNAAGVAKTTDEAKARERRQKLREMLRIAAENSSMYVEAQQHFETIKQQLIDSGVMNARNADVSAKLIPAWAVSYSQRFGVPVKDVMNGLTVIGPQTGKMGELSAEDAKLNEELAKNRPESMQQPIGYHGTRAQFTQFKLGRSGMTFFAVNREYAEQYGPTVIAADLNIQNVADLDNDQRARQIAIDAFNEENFRNVDDDASPTFDPETDQTWELTESPIVKQKLQEAGYDGAVFDEGGDRGRAYAVFDVTQINQRVPQTETENFKEWFGDSKVVDENGKPLVVYHGTRPGKDFEEFSIGESGAYFTPDPKYAEAFTEGLSKDAGEKGQIIPAYVSLKNPMIVVAKDGSPEWIAFVDRAHTKESLSKAGYDGAILKDAETGAIDQVIALNRTQIKSAIGNNGDFNPNDPNILHQSTPIDLYNATARFVATMNLPAWKNDGAARGVDVWAKLKSAGLKKVELEFMGLEELLTGNPDARFTRQQVVDLANNNGVKLDVVVAGGDSSEYDTPSFPAEERPSDRETDDSVIESYKLDMISQFDQASWNENLDATGLPAHFFVRDWMRENAEDAVTNLETRGYLRDDLAPEQLKMVEDIIASLPSSNDVRSSKALTLSINTFDNEEVFARGDTGGFGDLDRAIPNEFKTEPAGERLGIFSIMMHPLNHSSGSPSTAYDDLAQQHAEAMYDADEHDIKTWTDSESVYSIVGNDAVGYNIYPAGREGDGRARQNRHDIWSYDEAVVQAEELHYEYGYTSHADDQFTPRFSEYVVDPDSVRESYREMKLLLPETLGEFTHGHFPHDSNLIVFTRETDRKHAVEYTKEEIENYKQSLIVSETSPGRFIIRNILTNQNITGEISREVEGSEAAAYVTKERAQLVIDQLSPINVMSLIAKKPKVSYHIDELQSDWEQQANKIGYNDDASNYMVTPQYHSQGAKTTGRWLIYRKSDKSNVTTEVSRAQGSEGSSYDLAEHAQHAIDEVAAKNKLPGVPRNPFTDDAWISLGIKKALLRAVEGDYEYFSWASASTVVNRWSDRYIQAYVNQYDLKMPSIIEKLTGQKAETRTYDGDEPADSIPQKIKKLGLKVVTEEGELKVVSDDRVVKNFGHYGLPSSDPDLKNEAMKYMYNYAYMADGRESYHIVKLTPEFKQKIRDQGGLPLLQNTNDKSARAYYDIASTTIRLTELSNESSFFHEFAHFMYEMEMLQADSKLLPEIHAWFKRNAAAIAKEATGYANDKRFTSPDTMNKDIDHLAPDKKLRPFKKAEQVARAYMKRMGFEYNPPEKFATIDRKRGSRLAKIFDYGKSDPNDPEVKAAYAASAHETEEQFKAVIATGIELHFIRDGKDPYEANPRLVIQDVIENNRMYVFPTRTGFGSDPTADHSDNPLMRETDYEIDGEKILVNDMFRVVHDYFGHVMNGVGFRAEGEENAWQSHASMYSPLARRAVTSETRGQNSWVNFGPHAEHNRYASAKDTIYADQKVMLMPMWASEEGRINDTPVPDTDGRDENGKLVSPPVKDGRVTLHHFSDKADIEVLDPAKFGTAMAGAERSRAGKRNWLNRTNYGIAVGEPGGYTKERGLGVNHYTTTIDARQLYDIENDPDNLRKGLRGTPGSAERTNSYEKRIRDAGYSGYWRNFEGVMGMVAVVFDQLPVETVNGDTLHQDEPSDASGPVSITEFDVHQYIDQKTTGDEVKDRALRRAFHEQVARGFERYLMEGVAPSIELRNVFRIIARWMVRVYEAIKGDLRVNLDDGMRKVYDRMLATEQQIELAAMQGSAKPMFTDAKQAGMTDSQFSNYVNAAEKVKDTASEKLRARLIQQMRSTTKRWWNQEKQDLVAEGIEMLSKQPAYVAISELKKGEIKLDLADVKKRVGKKSTNKAGIESIKVPSQLSGMTKPGGEGFTVDDMAAYFGMSSGDELLYTLMNTKPIKQAAEEWADAEMVRVHGDIMNDGTIEAEADAAMQNEDKARLLIAELRAVGKGSIGSLDNATMRSSAAEHIAEMAYRFIHPEKYRALELKHAKQAAEDFAKGDKEGATFSKLQQLLNHHYAKAALDAKTEVEEIVEFMSRYRKKSVAQAIAKAGNGYWEQIVRMLERFEFRKSQSMNSTEAYNESLESWMKARIDEDGDNLVISPELLNEMFKTHWKNVPVNTLRAIRDAVKNIEHVALYSNTIEQLDETVDHKELVLKAINQTSDMPDVEVAGIGTFDERKDTNVFSKFFAEQDRIAWLVKALDQGDTGGLFSQILTHPMTMALNNKYNMFMEVVKPISQAVKNYTDVKRFTERVYIPKLKTSLARHQILAVALNTGNSGNLTKMIIGEEWGGEMDVSMGNETLSEILGNMSKEDWALVQTIWDQIDLMWPELSAVYERTSGLPLPKVERNAFKVWVRPDGTTTTMEPAGADGNYQVIEMSGGYYPVVYDPTRSARAAVQAEKKANNTDSMFSTIGTVNQTVSAGAANQRTGYKDRILFSLSVLDNHINEVAHYIAFHDAVRQANKFLRDPMIKAQITRKQGHLAYQQYIKWLNAVAKDGNEFGSKLSLDMMANRLRYGVTLQTLGFRVASALSQSMGVIPAMAEVGTGNVLWGIRKILSSPRQSYAYALERSRVLPHRANTYDRELKLVMDSLTNRGGWVAGFQQASMKMLVSAQYVVDLATWYGGYRAELLASGDEAKAIQKADAAVEMTQGASANKDLPTLLRDSGGVTKLLTMYMTPMSVLYNQQRDLYRGVKQGYISPTGAVAKVFLLYFLTVLVDGLLKGEWDAPDDDEDTRLQKYLTRVAVMPLQSMVFIRDLVNAVFMRRGYQLSPVEGTVARGISGAVETISAPVTDEEVTLANIKNASQLGAAVMGVPGTAQLWDTGEHLYHVLEEGEDLSIREGVLGYKQPKQ